MSNESNVSPLTIAKAIKQHFIDLAMTDDFPLDLNGINTDEMEKLISSSLDSAFTLGKQNITKTTFNIYKKFN